jgi:hypothetical protein
MLATVGTMLTLKLSVVSVALFIAVAACSSVSPTIPPLLGSSTKGGKGTPNGRSDSVEHFNKLERVVTDPTFGYSPDNPIKVGGAEMREGPLREKLYLNALRGSGGQVVEYERLGGCCGFSTPNGHFGKGWLDVFNITVEGESKPVTLYLNMYDPGQPVAPTGFTVRTRQ